MPSLEQILYNSKNSNVIYWNLHKTKLRIECIFLQKLIKCRVMPSFVGCIWFCMLFALNNWEIHVAIEFSFENFKKSISHICFFFANSIYPIKYKIFVYSNLFLFPFFMFLALVKLLPSFRHILNIIETTYYKVMQ